jgi:hypothetical protein
MAPTLSIRNMAPLPYVLAVLQLIALYQLWNCGLMVNGFKVISVVLAVLGLTHVRGGLISLWLYTENNKLRD